MTQGRVVSLATIGGGAAEDLFRAALTDVLRNIQDPNTDWEKAREITLKFKIGVVSEEREVGDIELTCQTKLAGIRGVTSVVFFGSDHGTPVAVEQPRQVDLFPQPAPGPRPVETAPVTA